jgi:hypothetical protein
MAAILGIMTLLSQKMKFVIELEALGSSMIFLKKAKVRPLLVNFN